MVPVELQGRFWRVTLRSWLHAELTGEDPGERLQLTDLASARSMLRTLLHHDPHARGRLGRLTQELDGGLGAVLSAHHVHGDPLIERVAQLIVGGRIHLTRQAEVRASDPIQIHELAEISYVPPVNEIVEDQRYEWLFWEEDEPVYGLELLVEGPPVPTLEFEDEHGPDPGLDLSDQLRGEDLQLVLEVEEGPEEGFEFEDEAGPEPGLSFDVEERDGGFWSIDEAR